MSNPLLRDGPISAMVHGVIEYVAGLFFIAAPLLLDFKSSAAVAASVVAGVLILIVAATTASPTGLINGLSIQVHAVLDYVLALLLIAVPFVLGFVEERNPTVMFIALGVVHLLVTIGTRFAEREVTTR